MTLLAITGSLRKHAFNTALRDAAVQMASDDIQIISAPATDTLPFFNPDDDDEAHPHPAVALWRNAIRSADGIMLFSPEYAHDIPGSLKNALDWVVGSGELVGKPIAIINASPTHLGAPYAFERLAYLARLLSAQVVEAASFRIDAVNHKIDARGAITDPATKHALQKSITALAAAIS